MLWKRVRSRDKYGPRRSSGDMNGFNTFSNDEEVSVGSKTLATLASGESITGSLLCCSAKISSALRVSSSSSSSFRGAAISFGS